MASRERAVARQKQFEKNGMIIGIGLVGALGVGVLVGLGKMRKDIQQWGADQTREKKPWERG